MAIDTGSLDTGVVADNLTGGLLVASLLEREGIECPLFTMPSAVPDGLDVPAAVIARRIRLIPAAEAAADIEDAAGRRFRGDDIPCIPCATFGNDELATLAAEALAARKACLLGNHGAICHDADVLGATTRPHRLEILARQYILALGAGQPRLLAAQDWDAYRAMAERFRYG